MPRHGQRIILKHCLEDVGYLLLGVEQGSDATDQRRDGLCHWVAFCLAREKVGHQLLWRQELTIARGGHEGNWFGGYTEWR